MKPELILQLLEKAKQSKESLIKFKSFVVSLQQYELAAEIRSLEVELFPEPTKYKKQRNHAHGLSVALNLVGIHCDHESARLAWKTFNKVNKLKGKFSVEDAVKIQLENDKIFNSK